MLQLHVRQPGGWFRYIEQIQHLNCQMIAINITHRNSCQVVCFFIGPGSYGLLQYVDNQHYQSFITRQVVWNLQKHARSGDSKKPLTKCEGFYQRCGWGSNPRPRAWQARILTSWTTAPGDSFALGVSLKRVAKLRIFSELASVSGKNFQKIYYKTILGWKQKKPSGAFQTAF